MRDSQDPKSSAGLNRRRFISALGAAADAGALIEGSGGGAKAQRAEAYCFEDSFGNVVPEGSAVAELGIPPYLVPAPATARADAEGSHRHDQPNYAIVFFWQHIA